MWWLHFNAYSNIGEFDSLSLLRGAKSFGGRCCTLVQLCSEMCSCSPGLGQMEGWFALVLSSSGTAVLVVCLSLVVLTSACFNVISAQCLPERCVGEVIKPHAVIRWPIVFPV